MEEYQELWTDTTMKAARGMILGIWTLAPKGSGHPIREAKGSSQDWSSEGEAGAQGGGTGGVPSGVSPPPPALRQISVRSSLGALSGTPMGCPLASTPVWCMT